MQSGRAMNQDIRWKQRFSNYESALSQLTEFIEHGELNKFEEQGLIKCFEYTYELAWKVIRDYFIYQGSVEINGSRDAIRMGFNKGLLADGNNWMNMVDDRIKTVHTYDEEQAAQIHDNIVNIYYKLFLDFESKMKILL